MLVSYNPCNELERQGTFGKKREIFELQQKGDSVSMVKRRIAEISDIFAFYIIGEQAAINSLTTAVRELFGRAKKSQKTGLKKLLFALERLPYRTPGIDVTVSSTFHGDEMSFDSFTLTEKCFTISYGGTVATENFGHDGFCNTWVTIEPGRRELMGNDYDSVADDIEGLASELECETCEIAVTDDSTSKFSFDVEPVSEDGWTRLVAYYRNIFGDDDD